MLLGSGNGLVIPLVVPDAQDTQLSPNQPFAAISFQTDGQITATGAANTRWHASGGAFWVRATVTSGTTPSGSLTATWLALSASRSWTLSRSSVGVTACSLTFEIATDSGGVNIVTSDSATITATMEI